MAARALLVIAAVGLLVFGIAARNASTDCTDRGVAFLRVAFGKQARLTTQQAHEFAGACRGSHYVALAASFLASHHQPELGLSLARIAIRREPGNYEGWLALSRALRGANLDQSATRAELHAIALNPRLARTLRQPG